MPSTDLWLFLMAMRFTAADLQFIVYNQKNFSKSACFLASCKSLRTNATRSETECALKALDTDNGVFTYDNNTRTCFLCSPSYPLQGEDLPDYPRVYVKGLLNHSHDNKIPRQFFFRISSICVWPSCYHALQWRHNERNGVSNHQRMCCLLSGLFRRRSKKTSKYCVTGLCERNSPVIGEFPAQRDSNVKNVSIWWWHHRTGNSFINTAYWKSGHGWLWHHGIVWDEITYLCPINRNLASGLHK